MGGTMEAFEAWRHSFQCTEDDPDFAPALCLDHQAYGPNGVARK